MEDLKVGKLYKIQLNTGVIRIFLLGYRVYLAEKPVCYYDLDKGCFGECYREDILHYKSLELNMIQNPEICKKALYLQQNFDKLSKEEKIKKEEMNEISKKYKEIKKEYDRALDEYKNQRGKFYDLESKGNLLGLELINMGFTLDNQVNKNKTMSIEEFEKRIWYYLSSDIKEILPSSFKLRFYAISNNDDGCFYTLEIVKRKTLQYKGELCNYDELLIERYNMYLNREVLKEPIGLRCLNIYPLPFERVEFFRGYQADIISRVAKDKEKAKMGLSKHRGEKEFINIYHSDLISREFDPIPLTEEHAKMIGESIFIDNSLMGI